MAFTLAHLSDLHLPVPSGAIRPLGQLAGKRLLAYLAWRRKRRRAVPGAALLADLAAAAPDHVAITGDLTNLALPGEFAAARDWLAALGPVEGVTVVPGNHDATVPVPWARGLGLWAPWMTGEEEGASFPFLRRRGPVALIGLSSAAPSLPGLATGRLGAAQLAALPALLDRAGAEGLFRVVLVHHPPRPGPGGRRKALSDAAELRAVLARHGAELVLHGHHHRPMRDAVPGPAGPIPVLGPPQALAAGNGGPPGWQRLRIAREGTEGWRVEAERRIQAAAGGPFEAQPAIILRIGGAPGAPAGRAGGAAL